MSDRPYKDETLLTHAGNKPRANFGIINPPVYHASTILYPTVAALEAAVKDRFSGVTYGRNGTPTTFAFEEAVAAVEGGEKAIAMPSGMAAIAGTLLTFLKQGDHLLVSDTVYSPVRGLCGATLVGMGVETTYYDPTIGAGIAELIRPNTRVVYLESPGSLTFEVQDVPAIAAAARSRGCLTVLDNTWATPLYFKPFEHGVDVSLHAGTKYITGHSDTMMGVIICRDANYHQLKSAIHGLGYCAAPDDCYLALRGLRTLAVRLARHQETALTLARWLQARQEVTRVMHPGLPQDPGHQLWKRDFRGSSGLLGFTLRPCPPAAVAAMLDGMQLFGLGYSWGGYESLLIPTKPQALRTAVPWTADGPCFRLHAGLEDPDDLIADLERGLARLVAAA
jgi:cysteine-S-conjugate beta-lyase